MKFRNALFAMLFLSGALHAQVDSTFNKFFLEGAIGAALPSSQKAPEGLSGPGSGLHLQGNLRYMFDDTYGVSGSIAYHNYSGSSTDATIGAHFVYNLGRELGWPQQTRGRWGLLAHLGGGLGLLDSDQRTTTDHIGFWQLGLKPLVSLNDRVSCFFDLSYRGHFAQDTYYNGTPTTYPTPGQFGSGQFITGLGIIVSLGNKVEHADLRY